MNILNYVFDNSFVFSFGWTLIHSLWHGVVIALLTLLIITFLKRQSSVLRYNIAALSLVLIFVLAIWTFLSFYEHFRSIMTPDKASLETVSSIGHSAKYNILWFDLIPEALKIHLDYFALHLPLIFTVWILSLIHI
jgi:hypothetical protein